MVKLLLLYDTLEKDLARDFKDLLEEINIGSITMIPVSPDKGLTLEQKEKHYFDSADGFIFIITPGCERLGSLFPSPSVTHEMGQAKNKFQKSPGKVNYLVEDNCKLPAIDQKAYIYFKRNDIRTVLTALTQLIRNLKDSALFRTTPIPTQIATPPKEFNVEAFEKRLNDQIKRVLYDVSNFPNGYISDINLTVHLQQKYKFAMRSINLIKRDIETLRVMNHYITDKPPYSNSWFLNDLGWAVVKQMIKKKKDEEKASFGWVKALTNLDS